MTSPRRADIAARVERLVRPEIRQLSAYRVADASGLVKLDAMENPYPLPADLVEQWLDTLKHIALNRYPDPGAGRLKARLRAVMDVPEGMELLLGNGSDELIQLVVLTLSPAGGSVLAPEPSFSMYALISQAIGRKYSPVALQADTFALDPGRMSEALEAHGPAVVFIAYPNNPTGNLFDHEVLEDIVRRAPGVVVIDEAYAPFAAASFMHRLPETPNLLVLRTLSKVGLAGLRLGVLVGHPEWIAELEKLRLPYNINVLTQASADFALRHYPRFAQQAARIRSDRERLHARLAAVPGVRAWASQANFILFRVPEGRGSAVFEGVRARGVLIKDMHGSAPALADCLRVTVGTPEENERFLDALDGALES